MGSFGKISAQSYLDPCGGGSDSLLVLMCLIIWESN